MYSQPKIDLGEMARQYQATFEANQLILNDFVGKLRKDDAIDVEFSVISPDSAPNKPQTALQLRNGN